MVEPLEIHVDADGTIWVDVGSRLVQVDDPEDLERILDGLAAERTSVRVVRAAPPPDDEDDPGARDPEGLEAAVAFVLGLARERELATTVEDSTGR
jgi:hypothetical protein